MFNIYTDILTYTDTTLSVWLTSPGENYDKNKLVL